jgi:hypothetical protein
VKAVQGMLGDKTATLTLDLYGHLFADELDAVAASSEDDRARLLADRLRTADDSDGLRCHGVLQAVNTYEHHEGLVRGASRPERNMLRAVTGDFARLDRQALAELGGVLA